MRSIARSLARRAVVVSLTSAIRLPAIPVAARWQLSRTVFSQLPRRFASSDAFKPRKVVDALGETQLSGKNVFVRVDFNVPQDKKTGKIKDATRIKEALPTIKYLASKGAKVILASHLGRPKKGPEAKFSLKPVAKKLQELLGAPVTFVPDCIGPQVTAAVDAMQDGSVVLLENARFYKQEEKNDKAFAEKLVASTKAEVYVNDAFGTAHRAHGTTAGVVPFIKGPAVAGFLMAKELKYLLPLVANPVKPFVGIIGGAKVDTKIKVIETLLKNCNTVVLGGAMIFPFYKAQGLSVGGQKVEDSQVKLAEDLMNKAKQQNVNLVLPVDLWVADTFKDDAHTKLAPVTEMPAGWLGLDIGPKSVKLIENAVRTAKTVFWNGPMGVFEWYNYKDGTFGVAKALASLPAGAITVVGGGDSVSALKQAGLSSKISHVSTGGGASLELLEGDVLPGVAALQFA